MKVQLEVLASSSIKRKKPWPRFAWMGEMHESLFMLDDHRLSVLYLPSGKTKRKVSKLQPLLEDVVVMTHSDNGHFICGLLKSGDLFLWHKDTDMLKLIQGHRQLTQATGADVVKPRLFIADDGTKILVVIGQRDLFLWELGHSQPLFIHKQADLRGLWTYVRPDHKTELPGPRNKEAAIDAVFYIDEVLGLCCQCSFVFNVKDKVCISTVLLRWFEQQFIFTHSEPTYRAEWTMIQYPLVRLSPRAQVIQAKGAYLARHSHDGQLVAVAVNQKSSHDNHLLFVSPLTDTVIVVDMGGSGARVPVTKQPKTYWTVDLRWTYSDLFVACWLKQGLLCIMTRLGEPIMLQTCGNSIEMGPKFYLPLHPLIQVRQAQGGGGTEAPDDRSPNTSVSEGDPLRQRFSMASHPRLPILLVSDGYMVTVLQMPGEITYKGIMKGLVIESDKHLKLIREHTKLQLTLFGSLQRQKKLVKEASARGAKAGKSGPRAGLVAGKKLAHHHHKDEGPKNRVFRFEQEPSESVLNTTQNSDIDEQLGQSMNAGQIIFGDAENLNTTQDAATLSSQDGVDIVQEVDKAQSALMLAWSLCASHCGFWTDDHETICTHVVHNLAKLFMVILNCSGEVAQELLAKFNRSDEDGGNPKLAHALHLFRSVFHLLRLDTGRHHLVVCAVRYVHYTLRAILTNKDLYQMEPRLHTLHGGYMLLRFAENMLNTLYTHVPCNVHANGIPYHVQLNYPDLVEPAVLAHTVEPGKLYNGRKEATQAEDYDSEASPRSEDEASRSEEGTSKQICMDYGQSPGKRLVVSWRMLYRSVVYQFKADIQLQADLDQAGPSKTKKQQAASRKADRTKQLLLLVQTKLQALGQSLTPYRKTVVYPGDKLCVEGLQPQAAEAWLTQLHALPDEQLSSGVCSHLLHALLYTLLQQGQLRAALELTEFLIHQTDVRKALTLCQQNSRAKWSLLALLHEAPQEKVTLPYLHVSNRASRSLVQSMARLLASYFANLDVFVYPAHAARRLPPLHVYSAPGLRVIPLYQDVITSMVTREDLGGAWTPDRVLDYLLISGLVPEAAWFADTMGDWKTAFVLAQACVQHRQLFPHVYKKHKSLYLPPEMYPEAVIKDRLCTLFQLPHTEDDQALEYNPSVFFPVDEETDLEQLSRALSDLVLAAAMCHIDLTPWLLDRLISKLKLLARDFSSLVPQGLYLPAPPVYCPQPATTSQETMTKEVQEEVSQRKEASSVIQLILLVLGASHTTLPAARWYVHKVMQAFVTGQKFKAAEMESPDIPVLQGAYLSSSSVFKGHLDNVSVQQVTSSFRDLCSIVWMLYVRDKLSLALRQKLHLLEKKGDTSSSQEEEWLRCCEVILHWGIHMLPFAKYLAGESDIFGVVLSQLIELTPSRDTCLILVEHFHNVEYLHPEIQDKLHWILKEWNSVFLDGGKGKPGKDTVDQHGDKNSKYPGDSPKGVTLSLYFHKQSEKMGKRLQKMAKAFGMYEEYVFETKDEGLVSQNGLLHVGSRPFESSETFLTFLDTFYAVSFTKSVDKEQESKSVPKPLLSPLSAKLCERELGSLKHRAITSLQKKQSMAAVTPQASKLDYMPKIPISKSVLSAPEDFIPMGSKSRKRGRGLFRSKSLSDIRSPLIMKSRVPSLSPVLEKRAVSHGDLSRVGMEDAAVPSASKEKPPRKIERRNSTPGSVRRKLSMNEGVEESPKLKRSNSKPQEKEKKGKSKLDLQGPDPLTEPLIPPAVLSQMEFEDEDYSHLLQLMEWLTRWAGKHNILGVHTDQQVELGSAGLARPVIRIKAQPEMVVYSLWLLDKRYNRPRDSEPLPKAAPKPAKRVHSQPKEAEEEKEEKPIAQEVPKPRPTPKPREKKKKVKKPVEDKPAEKVAEEPVQEPVAEVSVLEEPVAEVSVPVVQQALHRKISFRDKSTETEAERRHSSSHEDESTLNLSSLGGDELDEALDQALKETLSNIHGSIELADIMGPPVGVREHAHAATNTSQPFIPQRYPTEPPDVASELRNIVRNEMRRIMEAQHKGILAMLGALQTPLDYTGQGGAGRATPQSHHPGATQADVEPNLTDMEVSPLASEETSDTPLYLADLKKDSPGKTRGGLGGLPVALRELKQLENQHNPGRVDKSKGLQRGPQREAAGKENTVLMGTNPNIYSTNQNWVGQPPLLLRMPPEKDKELGAVHLPRFPPTEQGKNKDQADRSESSVPRMPLLRIDNSFQHSQLMRGVHKMNDAGKPSTSFNLPHATQIPGLTPPNVPVDPSSKVPFPLLHLTHEPHPFFQLRGEYGVPKLVPPAELIAYEQKKYQKEMLPKQLAQQHLQAQAQAQAQASQPESLQLLKAQVPPFQPRAHRDEEKRQKRRKKKTGDLKQREAKVPESSDQSETPVQADEDGPPEQQATETRRVSAGVQAVQDHTAPLHHGYALTPGLFDEYLDKEEEMGPLADTNAKLQYRAAMGIKKVNFADLPRRDAATETSGLEVADATTAMSRDAGTDPIHLDKKSPRAKAEDQGTNVLPPDIFLGLRFGQERPEPDTHPTKMRSGPRAFINVVDIEGDMLEDVIATVPPRAETEPPEFVDMRGAVPLQTLERAATPPPRDTDVDSEAIAVPRGPDRVTSRVLERIHAEPEHDYGPLPPWEKKPRSKTKEAIRKRLQEMTEQINAIDQMSKNMEAEYNNTRLLINTIDHIGEAIYPQQSMYPPSRVAQRFAERTPAERDLQQDKDEEKAFLETQGRKETDAKSPRRSAREDGWVSPWISNKQLEQIFKEKSPRVPKRTEEERRRLLEWMDKRRQEKTKEYKQHRDELREMETKPYKATEETLRLSTSTLKEIEDAEKTRTNKKQEREQENLERRKQLASRLMGDLLTEHPDLPKEPPAKKVDSKTKKTVMPREASPRRQAGTSARSVVRREVSPGRTWGGKPIVRKVAGVTPRTAWVESRGKSIHAPGYDQDRMHVQPDDYMAARDSYDLERRDSRHRPTGSGPHMSQTVQKSTQGSVEPRDMMGSSGALGAYTRQLEDMQESQDAEHKVAPSRPTPAPRRSLEQEPREQEKGYKPKPFTQMVRLQRPEVTRKRRDFRPKAKPYVERLAQLKGSQSATTPRSVRAQEKLYGTKRLPGTYKQHERQAPRVIKNYTERLQDMKRNRPAAQPITPRRSTAPPDVRPSSSSGMQQVTRQGASSPRRPRKVLTYAEQLQALQPPREDTVSLPGPTLRVHPQVGKKAARGPPHKPMTYGEQLRSLQPPSPSVTHEPAYVPLDTRTYGTSTRSLMRSRPYADPYSEDLDELSALSPWSMDEKVQRLLYDDEASYLAGTSMTTSLDVSELAEDYIYGQGYTSAVDVHDLTAVASVSSGSIMSFIDWDQVDQLIAEVK